MLLQEEINSTITKLVGGVSLLKLFKRHESDFL